MFSLLFYAFALQLYETLNKYSPGLISLAPSTTSTPALSRTIPSPGLSSIVRLLCLSGLVVLVSCLCVIVLVILKQLGIECFGVFDLPSPGPFTLAVLEAKVAAKDRTARRRLLDVNGLANVKAWVQYLVALPTGYTAPPKLDPLRFKFIAVLGRGPFGRVIKAEDGAGRALAIERIKKTKWWREWTSVEILAHRAMQDHPAFPVLRGLALHALHLRAFIHRDIEASQLLLDKDGHLQVTDFGVAAHFPGPYAYWQPNWGNWTARQAEGAGDFPPLWYSPHLTSDRVGTPGFMAPEVTGEETYSYGVDYWSMGITIYHWLFPGEFPCFFDLETYLPTDPVELDLDPHMDPAAKAFMEAVATMRAHPFFAGCQHLDVLSDWLAIANRTFPVPAPGT
ncbi:kinase-like domain-containing protein [Mycena crocata]|nr:kinase-like domain-containing protein [Mycena crocata]